MFALLAWIGPTTAAATCPAPDLPVPAFTTAPASPRAGEPVTFTATPGPSTVTYFEPVPIWEAQPDGSQVQIGVECQPRAMTVAQTHTWTIDGSPAGQGTTVTHAFAAAGTYVVSVAIGGVGTATRTITVTEAPVSEPSPPSNAFSIESIALRKSNGGARVTVRAPGPGRFVLRATTLVPVKGQPGVRKRTMVASVERDVAAAGATTLGFRPSTGARRILERRGKLSTRLELRFTPTGGTAAKQMRSVTLRLTPRS